jgi:hypothetical protein
VKEGSPNKERGGCIGAGSLQSQPGVNLHPNTANKGVRVAKGGEADGVALTAVWAHCNPTSSQLNTVELSMLTRTFCLDLY